MRYVILLLAVILLLGVGKALTEASLGDDDDGVRPHAINVAEPAGVPEQPSPQAAAPIGAGEQADEEPAPDEPEQLLDAAELDQLVAPIALYPDALLAQVLIASTYPLEVVGADRFVKANPNLKGDALEAELAKEDWDDSVKALVEAPEVLAMMSEDLDWLQRLGDAVLAQQPDVMAAVQRLRAKAEATGKLASTEQQTVVASELEGQREIVIQPARPEVIYVPYYEPEVVYGPWPYPSHPPYYFRPPPRYAPDPVLATGIAFGAGYLLGSFMSDGFDWRHQEIRVYRTKHVHYNRTHSSRREVYRSNWRHNAHHRRGVKYHSPSVQRKYAKGNKAGPKPGYSGPRKPGGDSGDLRGPRGKGKPGQYRKFGGDKKFGSDRKRGDERTWGIEKKPGGERQRGDDRKWGDDKKSGNHRKVRDSNWSGDEKKSGGKRKFEDAKKDGPPPKFAKPPQRSKSRADHAAIDPEKSSPTVRPSKPKDGANAVRERVNEPKRDYKPKDPQKGDKAKGKPNRDKAKASDRGDEPKGALQGDKPKAFDRGDKAKAAQNGNKVERSPKADKPKERPKAAKASGPQKVDKAERPPKADKPKERPKVAKANGTPKGDKAKNRNPPKAATDRNKGKSPQVAHNRGGGQGKSAYAKARDGKSKEAGAKPRGGDKSAAKSNGGAKNNGDAKNKGRERSAKSGNGRGGDKKKKES